MAAYTIHGFHITSHSWEGIATARPKAALSAAGPLSLAVWEALRLGRQLAG